MKHPRAAAVLCSLCILALPSLLTADVTLVYKTETKLNPSLPPAIAQALSAAQSIAASPQFSMRLKAGNSLVTLAAYSAITDLADKKITLLDLANKHFVTIPLSQYTDEIARTVTPSMGGLQSMLASMKVTADSKLTGRTDVIQGVQAEEHEITLSLTAPGLPNLPAALSSAPLMKLVMQIWLAKADETARNPALREFAAAGAQNLDGMNPAASIQKMLSQFPGLADGMATFMKEISESHSAMLRTHTSVFMPILAVLAQAAPGAGNAAASVDPNSPLFEMNQELAEISNAPLDDSVFRVPDGYTAVPLADIMSAILPKRPTPAAASAPPPAGIANPPGTVPPAVIQRTMPEYTEEAKAKHIEGSVVLSVLVGTDGKARDIQVVRSLDPGLDQKAIEAVGQWVFRPGTYGGVPVDVHSQVVVNFRRVAYPPTQPQ